MNHHKYTEQNLTNYVVLNKKSPDNYIAWAFKLFSCN